VIFALRGAAQPQCIVNGALFLHLPMTPIRSPLRLCHAALLPISASRPAAGCRTRGAIDILTKERTVGGCGLRFKTELIVEIEKERRVRAHYGRATVSILRHNLGDFVPRFVEICRGVVLPDTIPIQPQTTMTASETAPGGIARVAAECRCRHRQEQPWKHEGDPLDDEIPGMYSSAMERKA